MADTPPNLFGENSKIGKRVPRVNVQKLVRGRGRYVGDIKLPRMLHLSFIRSPYAHARIGHIDASKALAAPGVEHVFTGRDIADVTTPLVGVAGHRPGHKSAVQHLMATEKASWQGEAVAAVVARSRAEAEDAAELVQIDYEELPVVVDGETALAPETPVIHPEIGDNLAFQHEIVTGDSAAAFGAAAVVVEQTFRFDRQTGLTLEPRGLIADFDPGTETLTVYYSHQSPHQMQDVFSQHLGILEHRIRVIAPDVGGGFGVKVNVYGEEIAVCAISRLIGRPVKFCADRLESFVSDIHARDHVVTARLAADADGTITAMELDDLGMMGAYGMSRRFNVAEGMMAIIMAGAPYALTDYRARTRNVYVNKAIVGVFRGVGMPLACAPTEVLVDKAAAALGIDPVAFRRQNYLTADAFPMVTPGGTIIDDVSFHACLDKLVEMMDYDRLRAEQAELRVAGIHRGIGIATFVEQTAYGPPYYGPSLARNSVQDGCTIRLEPSGKLRCITSITDQGQGTLTGAAQIIASALGVEVDDIDIINGDSASTAYGGGAWASRGTPIGGEASLKTALTLRANILDLAGVIAQMSPENLDIVDGQIVDTRTGMTTASLAEIAEIGYFRQDTLPPDYDVQLSVTQSHVHNDKDYYLANGIQGAYLEIDTESGFIRLLGHWAVDDCGRVINPLLVDEQVRGGIVQGIGATLYEQCMYSDDGQMQNGTMADYLAPMAFEMPDIVVEHVETREASTMLGAKGIGEAGMIGAIGVMWSAVNDALRPLGAEINHQPFTPERILEALKAARQDNGSGGASNRGGA